MSGLSPAPAAAKVAAWVNFDGTGTVAIRDSLNVSSVTDNGIGNYTVNFENALPHSNYLVAGTANGGATDVMRGPHVATRAIGSMVVKSHILTNGAAYDVGHFSVGVIL